MVLVLWTLALVAVLVSRPTTAEPVNTRRSPDGGTTSPALTWSRTRSTATRVLSASGVLLNEMIDRAA